ncbi:MAG: discoidin domain-containing protein, partial [Bacteroidaceae bacterium]
MKKNYVLFVLLLLMSAAWTGASAEVWDLGPRKTDFKKGDQLAIVGENTGWWTGSNYINGFAASSAILQKSCIIELEATGEKGTIKQYPSYYLKQMSTGLYFGKDKMVEKAEAYKYEILVNSKDRDKYTKITALDAQDSITRSSNATEQSVVFVTVNESAEEPGKKSTVYFANGGQTPTNWGYWDTNSWKVYSVSSREDNVAELQQWVTYYTDVLKVSYTSSATNAPGFYQAEAVTRYNAAMTAAQEALESEDGALCLTAMTELFSAKANVDTLCLPMKEGYFRFKSAYSEFFKKQNVEKAIYVKTADLKLYWKSIDPKDANFIFHVTKAADGKNWAIQNLATNTYTTSAGDAGTTEFQTAQTFTSLGDGVWNLANVSSASPYHANGHGGGGGTEGNIVTYGGGKESASAWSLEEVTDVALLDSLEKAMVQMRLNLQLKNLVATAKTTYAAGWTPLNLIKDAAQFSTNALQKTEGSLAGLLDNDASTFFHSRWGGDPVDPAGYHYLQVALKNPASEFSLYTKMRNNNNRPDSIIISASNDSTTWTNVAILPNANDTLPYTAKQPEFNSSLISLGAAYSHVRFTVITTAYGGKQAQGVKDGKSYTFNGYPFFTYAEFQMYPKEGKVDINSQNNYMPAAIALKAAIEVADTVKIAATVEQIATLQAAIDAYDINYVDTARMSSEISAAQAMVESAIIGDKMGEVQQADVDVLAAAIATAKTVALADPATGTLISRENLDAAIATLKAAEKAFGATAISVVAENWYYIKNRMAAGEGSRIDNCIYSVDGGLKWGGVDAGKFSQEANPAYIWRFVVMTDSTYAVQNLATGQYMAAVTGASVQVKLSETPVPYFVKYFGSAQFGLVPDMEKDALPLHAAADANKVVGWENGANSASAWTFMPVSTAALNIKAFEENSISVLTLPYDFSDLNVYFSSADGSSTVDAKLYRIVGKEGPEGAATAIKLQQYAPATVIPAGTPVVVVIGDHTAYSKETPAGLLVFEPSNGNLNETTHLVSTPSKENGLFGVFNSIDIPHDGVGLLELGKLRVLNVSSGEVIGNFSGYISEAQIQNVEGVTADLTIQVGEGAALNIGGVTNDQVSKTGVIYHLNGVSAGTSVKDLKPGLYLF